MNEFFPPIENESVRGERLLHSVPPYTGATIEAEGGA